MDPLISVVMPAYNNAGYLRQAIDSVLAQTHPRHEIVVVDDGSTDATPEILRGYGDKIRAIRQENAGQSRARNVGIARATGELVAFLDADDLWLPEKSARQVAAFRANPDCALCCTDYYKGATGDEPRASVLETSWAMTRPADFDLLLEENFIHTSTAVVPRERLLAAGSFREDLRGAEDRDLWLKLLRQGRAFVCPEVLVFRRFHGTNTVFSLPYLRDRVRATQDLATWPEVTGSAARRALVRARLQDVWLGYLEGLKERREFRTAAREYLAYGRALGHAAPGWVRAAYCFAMSLVTAPTGRR